MVQGFRNRALATTDDGLISLTDRRASYIPVFAAFNALAHRVQDQDLFVFFFDGHGNRHEIELYDEVLQQEDVRALLGQISRGRKLLIFDSCEAGGFATAIQGMPRAAGLFAAREDEQAEIAPRLHAGGYLAYYVWRELSSHNVPTTSSDLFRAVSSGYTACGLRNQHVVLAGDGQMPLW